MEPIRHLTPHDADYPDRLRPIARRPLQLSVRGSLALEAVPRPTVAIVGRRDAHEGYLAYAHTLACTLARAGVVVISGGARGIDAAAHLGTIAGKGRTWAVAGTGSEHVFPPEHGPLYEQIAASGGAMIWPFPPSQKPKGTFLFRNGILVALSDVVVVVQADLPSGALNAATWAQKFRRPLWVVPPTPWTTTGETGFQGSLQLIREGGARVLWSTETFLQEVLKGHTVEAPEQRQTALRFDLGEDAIALQKASSSVPKHQDELAASAGLTAKAAATALLTLALEDVVVEGPGGFFRRAGP